MSFVRFLVELLDGKDRFLILVLLEKINRPKFHEIKKIKFFAII